MTEKETNESSVSVHHEIYISWTDINYAAMLTPQENIVEFAVYEIVGVTQSGQYLYHKAGANYHPSPVEQITDAEVYMRGEIKWDGCSDIYLHEYYHFCSRQQAAEIGVLLTRLYQEAAHILNCPEIA